MQEVQSTDRIEEPQEPQSSGRSRGRSRAQAQAKPAPHGRVLPRLLERYRQELAPQLQQEFFYPNAMEIPKVEKVVINVGLGEALTNARAMDATMGDIAAITGQRPISRKARRSVAGFKLREGQAVGVMVTLRGDRMYTFLDKLFNTALPRIRDFRGVSRSAFDGRGNYALGLREQIVFPEIDYNQIDRLRGMQVNIITTAKTDQEALRLLDLMGMPFARVQERTTVGV